MKAIHNRADEHPWTEEQGYHSVSLESHSDSQLRNILEIFKKHGWTVWHVGKDHEGSGAFLFRKSYQQSRNPKHKGEKTTP